MKVKFDVFTGNKSGKVFNGTVTTENTTIEGIISAIAKQEGGNSSEWYVSSWREMERTYSRDEVRLGVHRC